MTVRFILLCQVAVLLGVTTRTNAQPTTDCTRYTAAGLPCPPATGASRPSAAGLRPAMAQTNLLHLTTAPSTAPTASQPVAGASPLAPGPAPSTSTPAPLRSSDGAPVRVLTANGNTGNTGTNANGGVDRTTPTGVTLAPQPPTAAAPPSTPPSSPTTPVLRTAAPVPLVATSAPAPAPSPVIPASPVVALQAPPAATPPASPVTTSASPAPFAPGPSAQVSGSTLAPLAQSPAAERVAAPVLAEPGQIVIYWPTAGDADAAMARMLQVYKLAPTSTTKLQHLGGVVAVFQLPNPAAVTDMREQLRKDFPSAIVDFNSRYRPLLQPSPQPRIYLPQRVDLPRQSGAARSASGIRIGIVDGPVARAPALSSVKVMRKSFLADSEVAASASHATTIATLISGQDPATGFAGIAPQANLYSAEIMRTVGSDDVTNSAALVQALDWLLGEKVQLINLSLGGPSDQIMEKAFARLSTLSVVVVAAAGNGGPTAPPAYPAAYAGVIAVTATDAADKLYTQANRGSYVTLAAPGVDLWVPDGDGGRYVSGTSFSAAVVTAAGALLMAQNPQHHGRTMAQRLCRGAKDLGAPGVDRDFGCGLLQISASLQDDRT